MNLSDKTKRILNKRKLSVKDHIHLQSELNSLINPEWKSELTEDHFALQVIDEASELLGSGVNFKWWKHIDPDKFDEHNFKIEMTDIVFFTISKFVVGKNESNYVIDKESGGHLLHDVNKIDYSRFVKLIKLILSSSSYDPDSLYGYIISSAGMDEEEASAYYVTKFVLNWFRQDSGYKSGDYVKVKDGIEDNERLKPLILDFLDNSSTTLLDLTENTVRTFYTKP